MHLTEGVFFELHVVLCSCVRDRVGLEALVCLLVGPELAITLVFDLDPIFSFLGGEREAVLVGLLVTHLRILVIISTR